MNPYIQLTTDRMLLRNHQMEDLEAYHELLSNELVMYYLEDIKTTTIEESKESLENSIKDINALSRKTYFFRMLKKENNQYIGEVGFHIVKTTKKGKHAHLGYFMHQEFWGQGYMSEAVKAIVAFAFENVGVYIITSGCLKEHIASANVLLNNGFIMDSNNDKQQEVHQGVLKERVNFKLYTSIQ